MADLNTTDFSLPQKNHNNPPSDVEWLGENLTLKHVHIMRAADSHLEIVAKIPDHFTVENEANYVTGHIKLMQNCQKELERRRKEEKEPFLRQEQYVDSFFGEISQKLEDAIAKAKKPLNDWLMRKARAEQAARDADAKMLREQQEAAFKAAATPDPVETQEEREQAVEKAVTLAQTVRVADAIAAAPITSMASATSTLGSGARAGLTSRWVATIKNIDDLDLTKLRAYISAAELQKALDRYVKQGGRQCEGAEIKEIMEPKVK